MPVIYDLVNATVHYGASSYPLNGLGEKFQTITGVDDLDADALMREVGRLTSFAREFKVTHHEPLVHEGTVFAPERIVAMANGYTITWNRREEKTQYTEEQTRALNYFADAYLNTGCEEDEATEHAEFMLGQCDGNADRLYGEAERYRDM